MASRKKKDYTKLQAITECGICKLELSDPRRIECGHIFCLLCIGKHMKNTSSCPTCKRPMNPKSGKAENYPVATEIVHLLQSIQKVASCGHIVNEEDDKEGNSNDEDDYQYAQVDDNPNQLKLSPKHESKLPIEICDIHGQKLVFVCVDCDDELICEKCSIHSSHLKVQISQHTKNLAQLLNEKKNDLLQRGKDDREKEEKLQEMIEKQVEQRETIKDNIEEVAEEMFAQIHRKKEEMLQPLEEKSDEYVKQLTERQEHLKDRINEFCFISDKIEKLKNDGTTEFCRRAKRLVKQSTIALWGENKPIPEYQTIEFSKNETVLKELLKLQLGNVKINEVPITEEEEYTSDFVSFDMYENPSTALSQPAPPPPIPVKPKVNKVVNPDIREEESVSTYKNISPNPRPPLPPRPKPQNPSTAEKADEQIYNEVGDTLYDNTTGKEKHQPEIPKEKDDNQKRHYNPPPLSPFSGTFRKSVSILNDNSAFPQRLIHRVFLPFRPSGFTVVHDSQGSCYTFVTDDNNVKMFRQNGNFYRTITDVVHPFDIASQQRGESLTPMYITDQGKRTGDGSVRVYSSEGEFLKVLVGKLRRPQGIFISRVGLVYVCDEANILVLCPKTGKKKRIISAVGKDPLFIHPMYVMVSNTGKILVSDVGTRELKIYDETRKYTDKFKPEEDEGELYTSFTPGMCSEDSSSNYYVIDQERNMLYMLRGGGRSEKLELPQKPKGHDGIPTAVSFDNDTGNIVVF